MQDLIADFLARGGQIKKCEPGRKSLGLSDREWRLQTQKTKAERCIGLERTDAEIVREAELRMTHAAELARSGDRIGAHDMLTAPFEL